MTSVIPRIDERHQPTLATSSTALVAWSQVLVAAVAMAATLPGRTHGLGLITKPLLESFDGRLTEVGFSQINLVATLLGAFGAIPGGWLLDRIGPRALLTVTLALFGVSVVAMSDATSIIEIFVGATLSRLLGQTLLSVISLSLVGKWFGTQNNSAMGVYSVAMTILLVAATLMVSERVKLTTWQVAWREMGYALLILALLALVATRNPLQFVPGDQQKTAVSGCTLREALQSYAFWIFALSTSLFGMATSGISLYQELVFDELQLHRTVYQASLGMGLVTGLLANFAIGLASRKISLQTLLAVSMFLYALTLGCLPLAINRPALALTLAAAQGFAGGGITVLFFVVWGYAFGTSNLGKIQGAAQMLTVLASAVGPNLIAMLRQMSGSYTLPIALLAAMSMLLAVLGCFAKVSRYESLPVSSLKTAPKTLST